MLAVDPVATLLPDVPERRRAPARALVTCLRLLVDSGRASPAGVVGLSLERARGELELQARNALLRAVLDLVRHGLRAALGPATFAECGEPELERQRAWGLIEEHREDLPWLPEVPDFEEGAASALERLLDGAVRLGLGADEERTWRTRLLRVGAGIEAAERAWRELWLQRAAAGTALPLAAEALAGLCECMLERGAVRAALHELDAAGELARRESRLARLAQWARACLGEDGVGDALAGTVRVPTALAELRGARPDWLPLLAGHVAAGSPRCAFEAADDVRELRRLCGASVAALFLLRERGGHELRELDVAPALRERVRDWLRGLEGAESEVGSAENLLIVHAQSCVLHRAAPGQARERETESLRLALAPGTRSLALAPLRDGDGEVQGWLRLEFEHHLVPPLAALERMAERLARRCAAPRVVSTPAASSLPSGDGACAEAIRGLVAELGMKTAQRRWWGFELENGELRASCDGGAELGAERGGGRALSRAQRTAALVRWTEPDTDLALAASSASGLVLPIRSGDTLCGFLAVESQRRNDFPVALAERWAARAASFTELRIARFREWHRAEHGHDVWFAPDSGGAGWVEQVFAVARSQVPCALSGAAGSGRRVVARWLQFEGARAGGALLPVSALALGSGSIAALGARAEGGVVLVTDVERSSEALQVELLELWAPRVRSGCARWIFLLPEEPGALAARGALRPDLARRLERLALRVPSLGERRVELARIVQALLRRCAAEEGVRAPTLDDEALALLWRQPWPGNVRELENLLFKLVLQHPGAELGREALERTARRAGVELVRRASSRQPDPELLRAALAATANLRGTVNKTRAALYLGWDPDTLVSRMQELGSLAPRPDVTDGES